MINISKNKWGPIFWYNIHIVALAYPDNPSNEDKQNYKEYYTSIQNILPCSYCRDHYKKNLLDNPLNDNVLSSQQNLVKWTIDLHNVVNKQLNKKIVDYNEMLIMLQNNFIENFDNTSQPIPVEKSNNKSNYIILFSFILISLIIIAIIYKKSN
jgi:hypothetical protein